MSDPSFPPPPAPRVRPKLEGCAGGQGWELTASRGGAVGYPGQCPLRRQALVLHLNASPRCLLAINCVMWAKLERQS
jgi:hypothetical protein